MSAVNELDSIRTTVDVVSLFDKRIVPTGSTGAAVEVFPDGACLADITLRAQTVDDPGDFVQAVLKPDQFEVIQKA